MSGSLAGVRALVVTASTRAAAGVYPDRGGPIIVAELTRWGAGVSGPGGGRAGPPVGAAGGVGVTAYDLIITTGGTGCSPTDATPEATRAVIDREIPGVAEAIRADGVARGIPTAMISRGVAGVVGQCVIINLPGSSGGVRDGLRVLEPVLGHLVSQVRGGDH